LSPRRGISTKAGVSPRELEERDYRPAGEEHDQDVPKVISNTQPIQAPAKFPPLISEEKHRTLIAILNERAGTQRGKPRSRTPEMNPMGSRVFDMDCTWPMYRTPRDGSFRYVCGAYQQSHGQRCHSNAVDGPATVRFMLSCMQQRVLVPSLRTRLEAKLRQIASAEKVDQGSAKILEVKRAQLAELQPKLERVQENMALASRSQYEAIAAVFDKLTGEAASLKGEIESLEAAQVPSRDLDAEIAAAMRVVDRLTELADSPENYAQVAEAFRAVNARLFLSFKDKPWGKRMLRQFRGGVVTFGDAEPPIPIYQGPTARKEVKKQKAADDGSSAASSVPGEEGISTGNANRGERI
jgi:hypothetical protein